MVSAKVAHQRLESAFPELPKEALEPLSQVIASLASGSQARLHSTAFLDKQAFEYMTAFILTHHAMSQRQLRKENFEHAVEHTFRRQGRNVPPSTDPTRRGADIMIDGVRYSLKTHSSAGLSLPQHVDVSKFAESRWLREPLGLENLAKILELTKAAVKSHLAEYDHILLLHNHTAESNLTKVITYRLYEIPKLIFELTYGLTREQFSRMYLAEKLRRSARSARAPQTITACLDRNGQTIAKLSLDGSVEKLRFLAIALSHCCLQATWEVESPS